MTLEQFNAEVAAKNCATANENGMVGFKYPGKHVWHWFSVHNGDVWFDHSYSMNTGAITRGVMHRIRVQRSINYYQCN